MSHQLDSRTGRQQPDRATQIGLSRAYLDRNLLVFPLLLRAWKTGDTFCPFGMGGQRKKISDLLIDLKVSVFQKQQQKVLVNGDGIIVWVVGVRTDERFRVAEKTKNILQITLREALDREIVD